MKIIVSYQDSNTRARFIELTQTHMKDVLLQRKSEPNEFKLHIKENEPLSSQWGQWLSALANEQLPFDRILFTNERGVSLEENHAFRKHISDLYHASVTQPQAANRIIDLAPSDQKTSIINDSPIDTSSVDITPPAQISLSEDNGMPKRIPDPNSGEEVTMSSSEALREVLRRQESADNETSNHATLSARKQLKLQKFKACLTLLFNQTVELQHQANDQETSMAFRLYKITYEIHQALSLIENNYIGHDDIDDETFADAVRILLTSPLTVQIQTGGPQESVNIRQELAQHPQCSLLSILDDILWCIDLYRLATGTRLSFLKFAQPKQLNHIEAIEEETTPFIGAVRAG